MNCKKNRVAVLVAVMAIVVGMIACGGGGGRVGRVTPTATIGLEASILGVPVLCAGRARFTQLPTVFFPTTPLEYRQQAEDFLTADQIYLPPEFKLNARRFLYYQLFRSSLPFSEFLEQDGIWPGFVRLKQFPPQSLSLSASPAIKAIYKGILDNGDFLLDSDL
jgi:hypothetical protein